MYATGWAAALALGAGLLYGLCALWMTRNWPDPQRYKTKYGQLREGR